MKKIILISLLVFGLDFISKRIVVTFMFKGQSIVVISNFFNITYVRNTGVAFSMLEGYGLFIIFMTLFIIYLLFVMARKQLDNLVEVILYSLIIGGAFGNLLDRVVYGYVIDFLDFQIFGYNFPVFNLADCCIVIGSLVLFIVSYVFKGRKVI